MDTNGIPKRSESRSREMQYFYAHRADLARAFPRQWVAVVGEEVVAHGEVGRDVLKAAEAAGNVEPFVGKLPDPSMLDAEFVGPL